MSNFIPTAHAAEVDRVQRWALIVGGVAMVACVISAIFSPDQFFRAYLTSYQFVLGIALGSFAIFMIYCITGGAWGFLIQRILEAGMRTLPYMAVLFIPLLFGLSNLYIWARPDEVAAYKDLQRKQVYLNIPFFCARAGIFFALWIGISFFLSRWSKKQDETGDPRWGLRMSSLSAAGMVVFVLTITFASVDWIMSLQPAFHSTIFGPLVIAGQILSGHAVALIVLAWLAPRAPASDVLSHEVVGDLGNLLFTFLILWAYMVWFQFMLIWIANLPYEVAWLLPRSQGMWRWVMLTLLIFHLAVPFVLLLKRDVKRHLPTLAKIGGLFLVMQLLWNYYLVLPSFPGPNLVQHLLDLLAPLAIGGLWLASFLRELKRRPLLAARSADRTEAFHLRGLDEEAATRPQEVDLG
jgi:hypothetical protein